MCCNKIFITTFYYIPKRNGETLDNKKYLLCEISVSGIVSTRDFHSGPRHFVTRTDCLLWRTLLSEEEDDGLWSRLFFETTAVEVFFFFDGDDAGAFFTVFFFLRWP